LSAVLAWRAAKTRIYRRQVALLLLQFGCCYQTATPGVKGESRASNALRTTNQGFIVGQAFLAEGKTPKQAIQDRDTVSISPNSFLNTRLLGIDTPEVSLSLPGERTFPSIGGDRWKAFLSDSFAPTLPSFSPAFQVPCGLILTPP
jgi:hypothetical protein